MTTYNHRILLFIFSLVAIGLLLNAERLAIMLGYDGALMIPVIVNRLFYKHYYLFISVYFIAITTLLLAVVYIFRHKWIKVSPIRTTIQNLSLTIFTTLYLLLIIESIAYTFAQSDGFGFTLGFKRWHYQYWNPINSYGYREFEPEFKNKVVFVVGDSFVAGHGIKKISYRFSNILDKKLGSNWTVTILAKNGWNTKNYLDALTKHAEKPDVIIISYFINDIRNAAESCGMTIPRLERDIPNGLFSPLIKHSYVGNWIYWRIYRTSLNSDKFWRYLQQAYDNDDIWNAHTLELDALIDYAKNIDAKISFVLWPNLRDISGSKIITDKVSGYLSNKGVTVLDLATHYANKDPDDLVVNSMDAHPNKDVQAEVAQLLFLKFAPWNE